jgi:probable rRNA maturation factor
MPQREILIANRHPRLRLDRRAVARVIHTLDEKFFTAAYGQSKIKNRNSKFSSPTGELSIVFLTDPDLAQLHADFLADPSPTDVITFEGDTAAGTAGEICLSADAALRQISRRRPIAHRPSPLALSAELTLYLVHGWLHLAGYDDLQPAKKRRMRRAETRAMKLLQAACALPRFLLAARKRAPKA